MTIYERSCMLSIQFHYSNDRLEVFEQVIRIFKQSPFFNSCEKIILFNETCDFPKFTKIKLDYPFCRMDFWRAGLEAASFDKILYLDSDRLFKFDLFDQILAELDNNDFVYPLSHYMLKYNVSDQFLIKMLENKEFVDYLGEDVFDLGEDRTGNIEEAIGRRNPMSGCLGYHKTVSLPTHGYLGWGFSDMLWFRHSIGKSFKALEAFDLHLHHNYDKTRYYQLMNNLINGISYGVYDERMIGLAKRVGIYNIEGLRDGQTKRMG